MNFAAGSLLSFTRAISSRAWSTTFVRNAPLVRSTCNTATPAAAHQSPCPRSRAAGYRRRLRAPDRAVAGTAPGGSSSRPGARSAAPAAPTGRRFAETPLRIGRRASVGNRRSSARRSRRPRRALTVNVDHVGVGARVVAQVPRGGGGRGAHDARAVRPARACCAAHQPCPQLQPSLCK